jgi:phospholipase C
MADTQLNGPVLGRLGYLRHRRRRFTAVVLAAVAALAAAITVSSVSLAGAAPAVHADALGVPVPATASPSLYLTPKTATPIQHLVVIFDENESFDHYFGTYPDAANTNGEPFHAKKGTPHPVNLLSQVPGAASGKNYLNDNPNEYSPARLTRSEALTCDQDHNYIPEQDAFNDGAMNMFVQYTESSQTCNATAPNEFNQPGLVMDYFDGNTVTALWNYAQNYSMSDNDFDPDFGPSTPGALNLASGDDGGGYAVSPTTGAKESDPGSVGSVNSSGVGTIYGDLDPAYDDCSDSNHTATSPVGVMTGKNIGNLLNSAHITWGWFQGGFAPTTTAAKSKTGYAQCDSAHENVGHYSVLDYVPHHDPFQYYKSTANPQHLTPTSEAAIGRTDRANHQYDVSDFFTTLKDGNMPAVSFLKPPAYEDAHPGNSDPVDEQRWLVSTINAIEKSKFWPSTAIVVTYDDSDGWYDQVKPPIVNGSDDTTVGDTTLCSSVSVKLASWGDRCGYGPRLPLLVISPWTRPNYISSSRTDTASIIKFIENNWLNGKRIGGGSYDASSGSLYAAGGVLDFKIKPQDTPVILNAATGEVVPAPVVSRLAPAKGSPKGGTRVTIHGKDFTGATAVYFGTKRATGLKVVSSTKITVKSPKGKGTVHVTVVGPGGKSSSKSAAGKYKYT